MTTFGVITGMIAILLLAVAVVEFRRAEASFLMIAIDHQAKPKRFWLVVASRVIAALFFGFLSFVSLTSPAQCDDDEHKCTVTLYVPPK